MTAVSPAGETAVFPLYAYIKILKPVQASMVSQSPHTNALRALDALITFSRQSYGE